MARLKLICKGGSSVAVPASVLLKQHAPSADSAMVLTEVVSKALEEHKAKGGTGDAELSLPDDSAADWTALVKVLSSEGCAGLTMDNCMSVAKLADKYGLTQCKYRVEVFLIQASTACELSFNCISPYNTYITMKTNGGSTLLLTKELLQGLCSMGMDAAATALAPLYVRVLGEVARGDVKSCTNSGYPVGKSTAMSVLKVYVGGVLDALHADSRPAVCSVAHALSAMLLKFLTEPK